MIPLKITRDVFVTGFPSGAQALKHLSRPSNLALVSSLSLNPRLLVDCLNQHCCRVGISIAQRLGGDASLSSSFLREPSLDVLWRSQSACGVIRCRLLATSKRARASIPPKARPRFRTLAIGEHAGRPGECSNSCLSPTTPR